jgi:HSP20 family protein
MECDMTKISIYDPFADVFPTLFRNLFNEGAGEARGATQGTGGAQQQAVPMRVDVSEADRAYVVKADLPGVPKESIHVDIDGNRVTIRAEIKRETEQKEGQRVLRSERYHGAFARSFALTDEIDDEQASARFDNGVLELTLPKKAVAGAKRLSIQ